MTKQDKQPAKTGKKQGIRDEKGRFVEGVSGNPQGGGRPAGSVSITMAIKNKLMEIPEGKKKTYLALLIDRILVKAIAEGDPQTIKLIWNYIDSLPKERFEGQFDVEMSRVDDTTKKLAAEFNKYLKEKY